MATLIWLTNTDSEVSGYKVALIGYRSPNAAIAVSTTGTTAAGTDIAVTDTSGGTALKWLTSPLKSTVAIAQRFTANFWGFESNAAANTQLGVHLSEYTTSEQTSFVSTTFGTELGTAAELDQWSRVADYTSTSIDAGNRLVIEPFVSNVGTMRSGDTVNFRYNGATPGADGDAFIML